MPPSFYLRPHPLITRALPLIQMPGGELNVHIIYAVAFIFFTLTYPLVFLVVLLLSSNWSLVTHNLLLSRLAIGVRRKLTEISIELYSRRTQQPADGEGAGSRGGRGDDGEGGWGGGGGGGRGERGGGAGGEAADGRRRSATEPSHDGSAGRMPPALPPILTRVKSAGATPTTVPHAFALSPPPAEPAASDSASHPVSSPPAEHAHAVHPGSHLLSHSSHELEACHTVLAETSTMYEVIGTHAPPRSHDDAHATRTRIRVCSLSSLRLASLVSPLAHQSRVRGLPVGSGPAGD